jgi:hypothetical protein
MFSYDSLIQKYVDLVNDYLDYMLQSEILETMNQSTYITCIGLNTILHIFHLTLSITKDLDQTHQYCQKAYCWYLEYIEQMYKTNLLHNLDNLDAITFVYKKIMEEVQPSNITTSISTMLQLSNLEYGSYDSYEERESTCVVEEGSTRGVIESTLEKEVLIRQSTLLIKVLLFVVNEFQLHLKEETSDFHFTIQQMKKISHQHLWNFFVLFRPEKESCSYDYCILIRYIQTIQEKLQMKYEEYTVFLTEVYKIIKKMKPSKNSTEVRRSKNNAAFPSENQIQYKILECFYDEDQLSKIIYWKETKKTATLTKKLFDFIG